MNPASGGPGSPAFGRAATALRSALAAMTSPAACTSFARAILGPRTMSFLPLATIAAYAAGGESAMLVMGGLVPIAVAAGLAADARGYDGVERDGLTGLVLRQGVVLRLDHALDGEAGRGRTTACLVIEIDEYRRTVDHIGTEAADDVLRRVGERVAVTCRSGDAVGRLGGAAFAVALAPVGRANLEAVLHLAERLQAAVAEPVVTPSGTVHLTASVGFCLPSRAGRPGGAGLLEAAERAAAEARRAGPAAVRSYCEDIGRKLSARSALATSAPDALANGWIVPWFQPQLCTDTGKITGFEALARWCEPERGVVSPAEFLPALEQAGLMERLGEVMLRQSLHALRAWDRAGMSVPSVAVNFSPVELRNPRLLDRVRWDLDGYDLEAERLTVEVLETVVAGQGDDVILRNLHGLADLGCRIDLDDFGTGHASIGAIRRFPIARVKIDRSFVAGIEDDPEAHRLVSAILGMAERLGLETLAEGVETPGQHAILAQLGCGHVQGFGIARPMPFDDAMVWVSRLASRVDTPTIVRRTG